MSAPMVSVIIPTYNYGRFIEQALASVYAQTYRDLEVIVVDDGSTDDTRQRVASFPQTRYVYQSHRSNIAAVARGVVEARGRYAAILDADDLWLPRKLEVQMQIFSTDATVGLVSCGYECIDEVGRVLPQRAMPSVRSLLDLKGGSSCLPSTWVVPVSIFRQLGESHTYLPVACWDWDFMLRLVLRGFAVRSAPVYLVRRRVHIHQQAADPHLLLGGKLRVIHLRHRELAASAYRLRLGHMLYAVYLEAAADYVAADRFDDAGRHFGRAMRLRPDMLYRPATYYGILMRMSSYGCQTPQNASRHLRDSHKKVRGMLAVAARQLGPSTARTDLSLRITDAALGLGVCLVCLRAGALLRAISWLGRTFAEGPSETTHVLRMMVTRRLSRAPRAPLSSAGGHVQSDLSRRPAVPAGPENRAGSAS